VSFAVSRGAITALVGPRGAGKSSCLRQVIGLDRPRAGDVLVAGRSVPALKGRRLAKLRTRFGVMFQGSVESDCALFGGMNVYENVAVPLRVAGRAREDEIHRRTLERLEEVGLTSYAGALPAELTGPLRKRAALARALAARPEFALLDDLDPEIVDLCDVIHEHRLTDGATYLLTTRDADLAARVADDVLVLAAGRVVD
jgi:ABC-type transporter Mla maintaining outer membrane lipid asymmetry ATPase subunit MlaF